MSRPIRVSLLATLAVMACSRNQVTEEPPPAAPIFTGLHVTSEDGRVLRTWNTPADPLDSPRSGGGLGGPAITKLTFDNPFPNPASGGLNIGFSLPAPGTVTVRAAREPRAGESGTAMTTFYGNAQAAKGLILARTIGDGTFGAGSYTYRWNFLGDTTQVAPAGYYRIFVQSEDTLLWHDVFLFRTPDDLPQGLR